MPGAQKSPRSEDVSSKKPKSRQLVIVAGILILFAIAFSIGRYYRNHKYDSFAECLTSKQVKMYGLYWCPHCADQKAMFGGAFRHVSYVECAIKGSKELAPECKAAGVKLFPSWQFGTNLPEPGVLSLKNLSDRTGCSLP
jgi:hypothetical protein